MRNYQAMYYTGASISMLVGLWQCGKVKKEAIKPISI